MKRIKFLKSLLGLIIAPFVIKDLVTKDELIINGEFTMDDIDKTLKKHPEFKQIFDFTPFNPLEIIKSYGFKQIKITKDGYYHFSIKNKGDELMLFYYQDCSDLKIYYDDGHIMAIATRYKATTEVQLRFLIENSYRVERFIKIKGSL